MGLGNRSMAPVYKIRVGPKSAEKVAEHSLCVDRLTGACCVRGRHLRAEGVLINRTDQNCCGEEYSLENQPATSFHYYYFVSQGLTWLKVGGPICHGPAEHDLNRDRLFVSFI